MEILRGGSEVIGRVDYDGSGYESTVIILSVRDGKIKVELTAQIPVSHQPARLVLACFTEAFMVAEEMLEDQARAGLEQC